MSLDQADDDPAVLHADVAAEVSSRMGAPLEEVASPIVIVVDNLELVTSPAAVDVLADLPARLPRGSRMAVASRRELPLPVALLRSRGDVLEIGVPDLAMSAGEAEQLLASAGGDLGQGLGAGRQPIAELMELAEGWPVALSLAARAWSTAGAGTAHAPFRGDDGPLVDYIRCEILAELDAPALSFLTETSILARLSGPLCDAVVGGRGSQEVLESLERSNVPIVPLDRRRRWYRYHRLFGQMLLAELERREPGAAPALHARAAAWLETHHMSWSAIGHAASAGDRARMARLVRVEALGAYADGRFVELDGWFDRARTEGMATRYPAVAALAATVEALRGRAGSSERWALEAESAAAGRRARTRSVDEGWLALVRAVRCRDGAARMRADARLAAGALAPDSAPRALALACEGLSHLLEGDAEAAEGVLAHGFEVAVDGGAAPTAVLCSAELATLALGRNQLDDAQVLADRAMLAVEDRHLGSHLEACAAFTVAARLAVRRGDLGAANHHVTRAAALRPLLSSAFPATALVQLDLAHAHLDLADPSGAGAVLGELRDTLRLQLDLGVVRVAAGELQAALSSIGQRLICVSPLTPAELRLAPYLWTNLSFREIGARLYISRHTVKSQATAVYRKLGASSRSEAVERIRELGILGR